MIFTFAINHEEDRLYERCADLVGVGDLYMPDKRGMKYRTTDAVFMKRCLWEQYADVSDTMMTAEQLERFV